jgi:hypothetical protein
VLGGYNFSLLLTKIAAGRDLFGRKRLSIPWPEFIVLYNGTAPYPDEALLKLSEAFEEAG